MKHKLLLLLTAFCMLGGSRVLAQCGNDGTLTGGDLTPPGVGQTTTLNYASGQYVLAFVNAGANYTVTTCGTSNYDTQLTVYDDGTGTLYAYNDDYCGLQSTVSFTPTTCGYVRVLLKQYSCNSSGLYTPVSMTQNTAGNLLPVISPALQDVNACSGIPVMIGNDTAVHSGSPPYTYMWSPAGGLNDPTIAKPTATLATTQTYYFTVTDMANCRARDTVTVTVRPSPVIALHDSTQCGGSITLDASNAGSTYMWSNSSTAQTLTTSTSGTYSVTVTSPFGCVTSDTATLTINALPVVNLGSDVTQCGGTVTLDAGNPGFSHLWSDGSTAQTLLVSTSGVYYVTVTNPATGCMKSDTVNVTIHTIPVVSLGSDITQCGGSATLDAGNAGSTYMWSDASTAQTLTVNTSGVFYVTATSPQGCSSGDTINVTINAIPVVNLGSDTVQCGGTATLDAGNTGFNYLWNDGTTTETLVATASGMYYVTVTNPATGCMSSDSINVTINAIPVVNLGADTAQCAGMITLDAGNTGLQYMWNDMSTAQTLTATMSGAYSVTVTDPASGCFASDSINVTIYTMPVVNLGSDSVQCGGSILLDAGNAGDVFSWNTGETAQIIAASASGVYYVTVTNGLCASADTVNITIDTPPAVDLGSDITQCGGSVTLDAGSIGSYSWSTGDTTQTITVSGSAMYFVTVTNGTCVAADTVNVTINAIPTVDVTPIVTCDNYAPITLSNGTPAGGNYSGTGVSGDIFDPVMAGSGTYVLTYVYTDTNSCSAQDTTTITVNVCAGIEENSDVSDVTIYPNPANDMVNIEFSNANFDQVTIGIMNLQGKMVYSFSDKNIAGNYHKTISTEGLAKGVYYIRLVAGNTVEMRKLVIQ